MTSISIILPTAREDYPIIGLPNVHMFQPTIDSLKNQTFKDFELIVVDALYDKRPNIFCGSQSHVINYTDNLSFPVKHIDIHKNHRFWIDHNRWNVCGQLNTGIIHANGELLVRVDDCSEFDSDYLKKFWDGYQNGYFPMAMHIRYLGGKPAYLNDEYMKKGYELSYWGNVIDREKILKNIFGQDGLVRDTRYNTVKEKGGRMIAPYEWYYGYSSISLEAALKVNGYDELFDGDKSLEDVDMGSRLDMAGYKNKFVLSVDHQVIEHEHDFIAKYLIDKYAKSIKCNYAIYLTNRNKGRWRANSDMLLEKDIKYIRDESLKPPCSPTSNFYDEDCNGELFNIWIKKQPIFDLKEERREIRLS